jgi:stalled ribosome rescue protein Dom34
MTPKSYRRGYPVAVLVGIEVDQASIWQIYSQVAKYQETISMQGNRNDSKAIYNFYETITNALRPTVKMGVKSIIIAAPPRANFANEFLNHIKTHQNWLFQGTNKATFNLIAGSAGTPQQVAALTKTGNLKEAISQTTAQETENLLDILERKLNQASNLIYFSLEEAEKLILSSQTQGKPQPEYLLIADDYIASTRQKNRMHRLMQIAQNRGVKTRVITTESSAGKRLTQLGGIVCLAKNELPH